MAEMTPWVRQYTLRDLLDDSFDLFRERAATLMLAGMAPMVLVVAFMAIMRLYVVPENLLDELTMESVQEALENDRFWLFYNSTSIFTSVVMGLTYLLQIRLASSTALGAPKTLGQSFRLMAKPFFSLLVVGIIGAVFMWLAAFAGVIVGGVVMFFLALIGAAMGETGTIVMGLIGAAVMVVAAMICIVLALTFFAGAPVALAVEHVGPFAAIGKSFRYATANFKTHFQAVYIFTHIPVLVVPLVALTVLAVWAIGRHIDPTLSSVVLFALGNTLGTVLLLAFFACVQSLIYLDGRCRTEGFDLLTLARQVGLGDEVERALMQGALVTAAPQYPNYMAVPTTAAAPPSMGPAGLTAPARATGYPDYSAPPPSFAEASAFAKATADRTEGRTADMPQPAAPVATAYPNYSAPPPAAPMPAATPPDASAAPTPAPEPTGMAFPDYSAPPPAPAETPQGENTHDR